MKQKAKRDPRNKLKLEKKNVDLCLLNDITNTIFFNHEGQNKKENNTKNNENKSKSKPKYKNKNKIQYDPIIFRMIQSHNRKKWNWKYIKKQKYGKRVKEERINFLFLDDGSMVYDYNRFDTFEDALIDAVHQGEDLDDMISLVYLEKVDHPIVKQKFLKLI